MHRVVRAFIGFVRELDRGMAMMRGEIKPGLSEERHKLVRGKNGRSGT